MTDKPFAPATERNREAILDVLRVEFRHATSVLEIGSGTGQHAVFFAENFPGVRWQTSDRPVNHDGIIAWLKETELENVLPPLALDVLTASDVPGSYDAVFSANTAHIMSFEAVVCMFGLVASVLRTGGVFCLYGPFNLNGEFTSESNRSFDQSLTAQDPSMGIRDLEALVDLGMRNRLTVTGRYAMPANNMMLIWSRE